MFEDFINRFFMNIETDRKIILEERCYRVLNRPNVIVYLDDARCYYDPENIDAMGVYLLVVETLMQQNVFVVDQIITFIETNKDKTFKLNLGNGGCLVSIIPDGAKLNFPNARLLAPKEEL